MSKEFSKIQEDYKKCAADLKQTTKAEAEKTKKSMAQALEKCWDAEDDLREAIATAREQGMTSKKLADAIKDKGVKSSLSVWQKAVVAQKAQLDTMLALVAKAQSLVPTLAKLESSAEKISKSAGKGSPDKKEIDAFLADVKKQQSELKTVMGYAGKMKPGDKFYAVQSKKILEKLLSDDKASASEADLPKLLEEKQLKRSAARVTSLSGAIEAAHKKGVSIAAEDAKSAQTQLKVGLLKLKELAKLVGDYKRARKKCEKDIKANPDSKKLIAVLDHFDKSLAAGTAQMKELGAQVKKAAAA